MPATGTAVCDAAGFAATGVTIGPLSVPVSDHIGEVMPDARDDLRFTNQVLDPCVVFLKMTVVAPVDAVLRDDILW